MVKFGLYFCIYRIFQRGKQLLHVICQIKLKQTRISLCWSLRRDASCYLFWFLHPSWTGFLRSHFNEPPLAAMTEQDLDGWLIRAGKWNTCFWLNSVECVHFCVGQFERTLQSLLCVKPENTAKTEINLSFRNSAHLGLICWTYLAREKSTEQPGSNLWVQTAVYLASTWRWFQKPQNYHLDSWKARLYSKRKMWTVGA